MLLNTQILIFSTWSSTTRVSCLEPTSTMIYCPTLIQQLALHISPHLFLLGDIQQRQTISQQTPDSLWEKWCWAPLRGVEHVQGPEPVWPSPVPNSSALFPLSAAFELQVLILEVYWMCQRIILPQSSDNPPWMEEKWEDGRMSFIMMCSAALTGAVGEQRCYTRTLQRGGGGFRVCLEH